MTEKTLGIVLSTHPYNDSSVFVRIYTQRFGKITYKVSVGRSKRAASTRKMLAPMTLLDMEVKHSLLSEIQQIQEARILISPYMLASDNPAKGYQCMYMAELTDRTIREVEANAQLWAFLHQCVELLSLLDEGIANFHLVFTTRLSYLLGFHVDLEQYQPGMMFDINEGIFTFGPITHPNYLTPESASWLNNLLHTGFSTLSQLKLNHQQRNTLLEMMLLFLNIHIPEMGEIKTVEVLKELYS